MARIKVRYRKNCKEKYFTYNHELDAFAFDLVIKILRETDVEHMEISVDKCSKSGSE